MPYAGIREPADPKPTSKPRKRRRAKVKSPRYYPELELLECMVLPSTMVTTISWTAVGPDGVTPASGDWSNFNNWTDANGLHRLPGGTDDVYIDAPGITVDHYSGVDSVHSLNVTGNLTVDGGTLTVTGGIHLMGGSTLTMGPTATLVISGSQSVDGNGSVVFSTNSSASHIDLTSGTTWTIGSGIVVDGETGSIGPAPGAANNFTVVNEGTVGSSVVGGALVLSGGSWNNQGIIEALSGGATDLDPATLTNVSNGTLTGGTWKVSGSNSIFKVNSSPIQTNDATILMDGTGAALADVTGSDNLLADLVSNLGSLTLQDGATLTTGAAFTNAGKVDLETNSILNVGGVYTQTGGTTIINGLLTSTAFTMNIDGGTLAGDGTVQAVINPPSAAPPTLHHLKVPVTITLSDLAQTYDGSPEAVVATTVPAGLPVDITYNGSSTAPTEAGSYAVAAVIDDPNYLGSTTGTLVIGRATPTVTVTPVSVTYDAQAHGTTAEVFGVDGVDLGPAAISYSGSASAPTSAGSYLATATFAGNPDYTSDTATASINISPATASVTVMPVSSTYDAMSHGTSAVVTGVGGVKLGSATLSYSTPNSAAPVDAGTYVATGSFAGNADYTSATGTATISIAQATPTVKVVPVNVTYDAQAHGTTGEVFGVDGVDLGPAVISYSGGSAPVDAGSYTAIGTFTGTTDYTSNTGTASIDIGQAKPASVSVTPVSVTYDAQAHGTTAVVTGVDGVPIGSASISYNTPDGAAPVDAGTYIATGTFAGNLDYTSATGTARITIGRATPTVTVTPVFVDAYDGQPHGTTGVVTGVDGISLGSAAISYNTADGSAPVDAGSYTATGSFAGNADYTSATGTATISIGRAIPTRIVVAPVNVTYNGQAHGTTGEVFGVDGVDLGPAVISYSGSGAAPVDAGSYTATGSFAGNADYTSATGTAIITIRQATPTVTVTPVTATYDATAHGTTGGVTGVDGVSLGSATISYSTSDGTAPVDAGSYTATGSFAGNTNYTRATNTAIISIGRASSARIVVAHVNVSYDGQVHGTTGEVFGIDGADLGPAAISYSSGSAPVNVGSYTATGSFAGDTDYTSASGTATISILQAPASVTLSNLEQTYDGGAETPTATTVPAGLPVDLVFSQNGQVVGSPTAAGRYAVTATVEDPNYTGDTTGAFLIDKAAATVTLSSLSQVYSGSPEAATAATSPTGLEVSLTYNGATAAPTLPGSYAVTGTVVDPNYQGSATSTLVIIQAPTITSALNTSFTEGVNGTFVVTTATNGFPVPVLEETGNLPDGVTFTDNHDGTATLGGVPSDGTEGTYILVITATNAAGSSPPVTFALNVLTAQESGDLRASDTSIAENGQAAADVAGPQDSQAAVSLATGGSGPAALWVASYNGNPADQNPTIPTTPSTTTSTSTPVGLNILKVTLEQALVFLDVRVTGVDSGDNAAATAVFTFPGDAISAADVKTFAMQFFNGSSWQDVLSDGTGGQPPFKPIPQAGLDAHGNPIWTITVLFDAKSMPTITSLKGTVFTLALPTTTTTTTTVITQPQVVISTPTNSDAGIGLASSATFASNGQLSLLLRVSNENEFTASRTAVGGGGGSGDITFLGDTDDALMPWLRDVPWLWEMIRPNAATSSAAGPRQGAAAVPARPAAGPGNTPPAVPAASEESEVIAIDALFTENEAIPPDQTGEDFTFDVSQPGLTTAAHATSAAAWGAPLAAAAMTLSSRRQKPTSRGRKYRPALEGRR